jgi:plastocyanin
MACRARSGWVGLIAALGALAAACAIAVAAPSHSSARRHPSKHARSCRARARSRGRGARSRGACQRPRARRRPAPSVVSPGAASGPKGSSGTTAGPTASPGTTAPVSQPQSGGAPAGSGETGGSGSGDPPSVPRVQVTAVEYSFSLSRTSVPAGKVVFEFVNHGQDEHNLNLVQGQASPSGVLGNTPSGDVVDETIEMRPGTYTLFCSLPEHERKGMKATLAVE